MPSRDPSTGKRLSGAAQRRKAGEVLPPLTEGARRAFEKIGAPDLKDPTSLLVHGRRALSAALDLFTRDEIDPVRVRLISDVVRGLGASHPRGMIEEQVAKIRSEMEKRTAIPTVQVAAGSEVNKPYTARGMARSPRIVTAEQTTDVGADDNEPE